MTKTQTSLPIQEEHRRWRILIVEDDESNAEVLQLLLGSEIPCQAFSFGDPNAVLQALEEIKALAPALFIIDYSLPQMTGVQLYQKLHQSEGLEQVPGMILTAHFLTKEIIKEARPDSEADLVFVLAPCGAFSPCPSFLPCQQRRPGIIEEAICPLTLSRSYRRYPARGRYQDILLGLLRRHIFPPCSQVATPFVLFSYGDSNQTIV